MRHAYQIVITAALAGLLCFSAAQAAGDKVKVILYNGKTMEGELIEESPEYLVVLTDLGQIRTRRAAIESVLYLQRPEARAAGTPADSLEQQPLNDLVVVHLLNGETANGSLISKSLDSILLKTEWGRLTIPKTQVKLIEYVNSEYAERGEPVTARLTAGNVLQGYIFNEDRNTVTLETNIGRLTLDKKQLRSLEYHAAVKPIKPPKLQKSAVEPRESAPAALAVASTPAERTQRSYDIQQHQDSFFIGYAPDFGENYKTGFAVGYCNRYLLKEFTSFSLFASAQLSMAFFSLNQDLAKVTDVPGSMTAEGGAMVNTLSLGLPIHFLPTESPSYTFFLRPALEPHLVYTSLKKSYPSFPQQNSDEKSTKFRFGLGTEVGLEWTLNPRWSVGLAFGMHFIASADDYNCISLSVGTQLY